MSASRSGTPTRQRRSKPDRELASRKADGELASALHALGLEWDVVGGRQVTKLSVEATRREVIRPALARWEAFLEGAREGLQGAVWWGYRAGASLGWFVLVVWLVREGCR